MAYKGYLLKIGDYVVPHNLIKADSYQAYINMQDIDDWTDSNGFLHREHVVELKVEKVELETKAMLTNKQFDEGLISNIRDQFVKPSKKECYITAYIPELADYITQYGYMADFTPQMYSVSGGIIKYNPVRLAFIGGVYHD